MSNCIDREVRPRSFSSRLSLVLERFFYLSLNRFRLYIYSWYIENIWIFMETTEMINNFPVNNLFSFSYPLQEAGLKSTIDDQDKASHQTQTQSQSALDQKKLSQHTSGNPVKNYVLEQLAKLMTTCMVIKIDDFTIFKVTSSTRKPTTKEFIAGKVR